MRKMETLCVGEEKIKFLSFWTLVQYIIVENSSGVANPTRFRHRN